MDDVGLEPVLVGPAYLQPVLAVDVVVELLIRPGAVTQQTLDAALTENIITNLIVKKLCSIISENLRMTLMRERKGYDRIFPRSLTVSALILRYRIAGCWLT